MIQHHEVWLDDTIVLARGTYTETRCQKKFKFVFLREEQILKQACRLRALQYKNIFACAELKWICVGVFHDAPEYSAHVERELATLKFAGEVVCNMRDMEIVGIASKTLALLLLIF